MNNRAVGRRLASVACVCACLWAALVVTAPALAESGGAGATASAASYLVGSVVCHQRGERSFHAGGAQFPVCARCTGLYVGGAWGLLAGLLLGAHGLEPMARWARRSSWRQVLIAAALPMCATVALEWAGAWSVPNAWRAAASLPAAWAVGVLAAESLSFRVTL